MAEQEHEAQRSAGAVVDVVAGWLRARAGLSPRADLGEHAHWDPVNRTWQYHTHRADRGSWRR